MYYRSFEELSQAIGVSMHKRTAALAQQHQDKPIRLSRKQINRLNRELMEEFAKKENEIKD